MRKVLSLFTGCGGMDLGFEGGFAVSPESAVNKNGTLRKLPFETVFANDILPFAKAAWENHFGSKRNVEGVYHLESIVDLVKAAKNGEKQLPYADVVTGGFPCTDFSYSGKRMGFNSTKTHDNKSGDSEMVSVESRGMLYYWMREVISIVRPKVFVAENVKGLTTLDDAQQVIEQDFRSIGYAVVPAMVLRAVDYGVPQTRERVIFIGFRKDAMNESLLYHYEQTGTFPNAYDPYPEETHDHLSRVGTRTAFRGLAEPHESDDPSQQAFSRAKFLQGRQGNKEVDPNRPGPTIRAEHHGNIEYRRLSQDNGGRIMDEYHLEERRLTVRECARLQTFPDDYEFVADKPGFSMSSSQAYKVIGNAVPPLLAWHIAKRLDEIWDKVFV